MLKVRGIQKNDFDILRRIHEQFYAEGFVFPFDRYGNYSNKFVIEDELDRIVTFGMLELNAEAIVLTDKGIDFQERIKALNQMLPLLVKEAKTAELKGISATTYADPVWEVWLKRAGFKESKGSHLFYKIGD